jgi:hypothetical protein
MSKSLGTRKKEIEEEIKIPYKRKSEKDGWMENVS